MSEASGALRHVAKAAPEPTHMSRRPAEERHQRAPTKRAVAWVVATGLIAFASGFLSGRASQQAAEPNGDPIPIDLRSGRYVSLGDSYSAGEGLPPYAAGTESTDKGGDRCHRSSIYSYARLFTFTHKTIEQFRACSGAVTANVFGRVQDHSGVLDRQGLQVAPAVAGSDVRLVTLTMGGNDVGFADVLMFCFKHPDCASLRYMRYDTLNDWAAAKLAHVKEDLVELYQQLRAAFPAARILVLDYPALFPLKAPPAYDLPHEFCRVLFSEPAGFGYTLPERAAIRGWGDALNRVVLEATQAANANIEFVDIAPYFAGHEPCTGAQWVRFVGLQNDAVRDGSFHPNSTGQRIMAIVTACHLAIFDSAETVTTRATGWAMTGCVAEGMRGVVPTSVPSAGAT